MMLLNPYRFAAGGGGGDPEPLLWSLTDKGAGFTVSGDQKTATRTATANVGATVYRSSGKRYFEVVLNSGGGTLYAHDPSIHVATSSFDMSAVSTPGATANSWALLHNGQKRHNSGASAYIPTGNWINGSVVCVAVDFSAGSIWFAINGAWVGSGEPGAGATPAFTNLSGPVRPGAFANSGTPSLTIRGSAEEFSHPVPAGFLPWSDPE